MKLKPLLVLGILLIASALLISNKPKYDVKIIDIDKPTDDTIQLVKPISDIVTDINDKAKLALFNYEFSKRVINYETDVQKLNDVYVLSAFKFFKDSLSNKYDQLDSKLINLIAKTTKDDNHVLSQSEKNELSKNFSALSWSLINN